jgi:16S rRNA (cytosine967-C5)-methyltransferase
MNKNPREIALDVLLDIEKNNTFSNEALGKALRSNQFMDKKNRAYINRIVSGVTEQRIKLDYIINQFSKTKVSKCKPLIRCVLRMGVYEIFYMTSIPEEATCNEYVKLTTKRHFNSLKGFVNGVLRNISRNKDNLNFPDRNEDVALYMSVEYSCPEELVQLLMKDYDIDILERILSAQNDNRGTTIRVNQNKISVDEYKKILTDNGIKAEAGKYNKTSLIISDYDYIRRVPGFFDGYFTVQDESSSLAVMACGIKKGDIIVDMCAAPGGKTLYASEITGATGKVYAGDISQEKVDLIEENIERLNIENVEVTVRDATAIDEKLLGKADVVIADLPCSGLGVMARKNDIKYHVTENSIEELSSLQRQMLTVAAGYVKSGGTLVFSTCTIDTMENEKNVAWFTENYDFELQSMEEYMPDSLKDRSKKGYMTLLQGVDECDGFFISRMIKK